jgi:UDP-N-acetylmuramate dehydrogenase
VTPPSRREASPLLLADYTTLGLGGPARRLVPADTEPALIDAVRSADKASEPMLLIGGGSNLVISDAGFPGTVIHVNTRGLRRAGAGDGTVDVTVAAGEDWDDVVAATVADGLAGLEPLSGIPGRAGATPIQNVGAYGREVAEVITQVRVYDRQDDQIQVIQNEGCSFSYRTSLFKSGRPESLVSRPTSAPSLAAGSRAAGPQAAGPGPRAAESRAAGPGPGVAGSRATGSPAAGSPAAGPRAAGSRAAGRQAAGSRAAGQPRYVVLDVTFRLTRQVLSAPVRYPELAAELGVALGEQAGAGEVRAAVLKIRARKGMVLSPGDPDTRSAGSFFTNPVVTAAEFAGVEAAATARCVGPVPRYSAGEGLVKVPAGWLIEHSGFAKGYGAPGPARVSSKHTLALVNAGNATTADLLALARAIVSGVQAAYGVTLTPEPTFIGVTL